MKLLLLVLSIVVLVTSSLPTCKKVYYNFMQLALTWPQEYCSEKSCVSNWQSKWDGKSLVIHGMWPSSTDLAYLSCQKQGGYDHNCYDGYNFDITKFDSQQKADLNKYWPEIGTIKNFWAYQWKKHGTCYMYIIKDEQKSTLSKTQIFKKYFTETIKKVKNLNIHLTHQKVDSQTDLAKLLGLHASQFYAICGRDNELDEIRICYDIYYKPGQQYVINCPKSGDSSQCKYPMYIK